MFTTCLLALALTAAPATRPAENLVVTSESVLTSRLSPDAPPTEMRVTETKRGADHLVVIDYGENGWQATLFRPDAGRSETYNSQLNQLLVTPLDPAQVQTLKQDTAEASAALASPRALLEAMAEDFPAEPDTVKEAPVGAGPAGLTATWDDVPPEVAAATGTDGPMTLTITAGPDGCVEQVALDNVMGSTGTVTFTYGGTPPPASLRDLGGKYAVPADAEVVEADPNALTVDQARAAAENLVGQDAPDFTLPNLAGGETTLSDYTGQVVVLDFWATWCPPCVAALPHLAELAARKGGPVVLAVNVGETPDQVGAFLETHDLNLNVPLDADASAAEKYFVTGIPQTVVVGPDGVVRKVLFGFGPDTPAELDAAVADAAREPPTRP